MKGPGCPTGWNQGADSWGSIELTQVSTGQQDHQICFMVYPLTSSFLLSCKKLYAFARVSNVHQCILCFEIQFCFQLASISSEVKHRYEYTRTSNIINVRPQACWKDTDRSDIQKVEKIISKRKQDSIRHRKVPEQLVTYVLRMRGTGFEFDILVVSVTVSPSMHTFHCIQPHRWDLKDVMFENTPGGSCWSWLLIRSSSLRPSNRVRGNSQIATARVLCCTGGVTW